MNIPFSTVRVEIRKLESASDLLKVWFERAYRVHVGHYESAGRYQYLTSISVALQALVGTSIFAAAAERQDIWLVPVAVISFISAMITAQRFGEKATEHLKAGRDYSSLKREIEQQLVLRKLEELPEYIEQIRLRWDTMNNVAPIIPRYVWKKVNKMEFSFGTNGSKVP